MKRRAQGDLTRLAMAARLRGETTLTTRRIAAWPHPRSWKRLRAKLHLWRQTIGEGIQ